MLALNLLALVAAVAATDSASSSTPSVTDVDILQYALTLEHLEAAFYKEALGKFKSSDFASGGEQYTLFQQIAGHEQTHVETLTSVIGADKATKACNYSFPYTDVGGFKALAQVLEGVGTSAYLGAAHYLTNPAYVTAAGSILTVEARHSAWLATTNGEDPWPGAFDTPLGLNQVYSLAAAFITSCPSTNPALPVKAFPALSASTASNLKAGESVTFNLPSTVNSTSGQLYAAFLTGGTIEYAPYTVNQSVTIPTSVNSTGTIYAVITSSNSSVTDDNTVAGPAVLQFNGL
ncbi:hypothetical protein EXIGLDRAFT_329109 [Exidia glandulosa HHB12029]|uniref:Ferritin-like domain-containing protein n=1 Tax=Exidia glandulosa HHB12029 TaxID=1314781 RepID=A0A165LQ93_EXIGL|nr:hypothetical protein EXIGLDRAFT_329109 [Exidia glandulosa HHB12029]